MGFGECCLVFMIFFSSFMRADKLLEQSRHREVKQLHVILVAFYWSERSWSYATVFSETWTERVFKNQGEQTKEDLQTKSTKPVKYARSEKKKFYCTWGSTDSIQEETSQGIASMSYTMFFFSNRSLLEFR